ncbi:trypsin-like peptidase domain-containing protein [Streptomyces sp. L2]|uniref:VMAP-C domain-containing protein n=1 Tax=Streptomyces sp. L2 TaxID=2162665 RepID=UPI0010128D16|nr:trypsin-like peptidase domain-containing protein [Streptomyces sp. L2]
MRGPTWHARIECGGMVLGAGFLVAPSTVLTCAHVVRARDAGITVSFPGRPDLPGVTASVAVDGGWAGGVTDPGDLAVLRLADQVPLCPAAFAPPGSEQGLPAPPLVAYGFPDGFPEGQLAEYRAVSATRIADQWLQLEAVTGHGQPLAPGFSGAALALKDGRVVGMVTQIAGEEGVRVARMLPTEVLARYWPGLRDRVPARVEYEHLARRLHGLVRRAEAAQLACAPEQLFVDAVGDFGPEVPPGGFPSLREAAAYVQWEVDEPAEALGRFADRLTHLLDGPACTPSVPDADTPTAGASTSTARAGAPATDWAPILVEIDRSGVGADQVTVSVSAYREGRRRPVARVRLDRAEMREYIQAGIEEAYDQLAFGAEELLAFVLPEDLLNLPVAQWPCRADDSTPLGCAAPVVVTDRSRLHGRLRHHLGKQWRKLARDPFAPLHRVGCGALEEPAGLRRRLREKDAGLAGFGAPPDAVPEQFKVSLNMPVPVLLWPRSGCAGSAGHTEPCAGTAFLDAVSPHVEGVAATELPHRIKELREEAAAEPERHWAHDVQLLWDDPRCFPEPAASLHSPVA